MVEKHISRKKQVREYADYVSNQMLRWAQKRYKLSEKIIDYDLIASFDKKRIYSYGGWHKKRNGHYRPYLNLSISECVNFKPQLISEYDWYKKDPIIGQRWAATWKYYIRFLVAHEVSHVVEMAQHFLNPEEKERLINRFGRSKLTDDHSENFQKIYRILRRKYVNRVRKIK